MVDALKNLEISLVTIEQLVKKGELGPLVNHVDYAMDLAQKTESHEIHAQLLALNLQVLIEKEEVEKAMMRFLLFRASSSFQMITDESRVRLLELGRVLLDKREMMNRSLEKPRKLQLKVV